MVRVGIVGATGYGGRELLRLLLMHPEAELSAVASTSAVGQRLDRVLPAFRNLTDLVFEEFDPAALAKKCDVVFVGVPGKESMGPVSALRAAGVRVIDIGPDFRLRDASAWTTYYKAEHTAPQLMQESVYGLVPFYREALRDAQLVAVPGCYPISLILPLRPLMSVYTSPQVIIADCVSGISGAGRTPSEAFHYPEINENMKAYKLGVHQHVPEIEQELDFKALVQFTPHVAPLTRGILSTITLPWSREQDIASLYRCYDNEPFVRVLGPAELPEIRYVRGSNFCDFGWVLDERTGNLVIVSAIDNLCGGTAGMAVQCMNVMFGIAETTGLLHGGIAP
jgi:N-acetyl-gamma-glutamyl-phosphate reductase